MALHLKSGICVYTTRHKHQNYFPSLSAITPHNTLRQNKRKSGVPVHICGCLHKHSRPWALKQQSHHLKDGCTIPLHDPLSGKMVCELSHFTPMRFN